MKLKSGAEAYFAQAIYNYYSILSTERLSWVAGL